jgi:hypothetical protein
MKTGYIYICVINFKGNMTSCTNNSSNIIICVKSVNIRHKCDLSELNCVTIEMCPRWKNPKAPETSVICMHFLCCSGSLSSLAEGTFIAVILNSAVENL